MELGASASHGGRAAGHAGLLQQDDLRAALQSLDSSGQARSAAADHDDVGLQGLLDQLSLGRSCGELGHIRTGLGQRVSQRSLEGLRADGRTANSVNGNSLSLDNSDRKLLQGNGTDREL